MTDFFTTFWAKINRYVKPTSLTWWVGVMMIVSGCMQVWGGEIAGATPILRPLLAEIAGGGAIALIGNGLGLIGLRGAFDDLKEKVK